MPRHLVPVLAFIIQLKLALFWPVIVMCAHISLQLLCSPGYTVVFSKVWSWATGGQQRPHGVFSYLLTVGSLVFFYKLNTSCSVHVFVSDAVSLQALGPYSVSKTALLGLTRALAPELAHSNIRVNCVAPGVIKTRFSSAVRRKTRIWLFKKKFSCILLCFTTSHNNISLESHFLFIFSVVAEWSHHGRI